MENTYEVEAICNQREGINVTFKGFKTVGEAFECVAILITAFPDVRVVCEQTGEVIYNRYISLDHFDPTCEMGKAIFLAEMERYI